ncbi:hypothetical protein F4776DRAFT_649425 [Hypoxylon sp. NC0597]|nr:hypothetical protein F4776DRAFT_649425 [Hypoxylon sp. NC0597]
MSSFTRTFIPIGLAIAFGVWNGYYAFDPAFKDHQKASQSIAKDTQPTDKATEASNQQRSPKDDASSNR